MNGPIVVNISLETSEDKVWKALTVLSEMKKWYFENIPEFEPEVGFETTFQIGPEDNKFTVTWKVLSVIKKESIAYTWTYKEYDGLGITDFRLSQKDGKTHLTLINEGIDSFPQNIPSFTRASCKAGWEYFLHERLKNYLER